jgi:hypothetical protein
MVMPTLPVEGVFLLLGSDLAGEMAMMNPIVYDEPSYEDNEIENTEVFSACVVTRDMMFQSILLSLGQSINHDNALCINNYYISRLVHHLSVMQIP